MKAPTPMAVLLNPPSVEAIILRATAELIGRDANYNLPPIMAFTDKAARLHGATDIEAVGMTQMVKDEAYRYYREEYGLPLGKNLVDYYPIGFLWQQMLHKFAERIEANA